MKAETAIRRYLRDIGVELIFGNKAVDVEVGKAQNAQGDMVLKVLLEKGQKLEADAFVDGSGGAGGVQICKDYGYGCVECMLRCNSFGDRVSIATKAGAPELRKIRDAKHGGGFGGLSSACSFYDDSIDPELLEEVKREGSAKIPVPEEVQNMTKIGLSTNLPYDPSHVKSIKVAYPGFFKANGLVFMPLEDVRKLKGMQDARYSDPLGGGVGNAVRFMSMAPRDDSLRVIGFRNLFVAGEKGGHQRRHPRVHGHGLARGLQRGPRRIRVGPARPPEGDGHRRFRRVRRGDDEDREGADGDLLDDKAALPD